MAYADAANAVTGGTSATFQQRVQAAMFAKIVRVGTGSFTVDKEKTYFLALCNQVINNPGPYVTAFAWFAAAYYNLTPACLDSDLDTAINNLWPAISGYTAATA